MSGFASVSRSKSEKASGPFASFHPQVQKLRRGDLRVMFKSKAPFTLLAEVDLHANPSMLLATCVNTPSDLRRPVVRCSASCVNWPRLQEFCGRMTGGGCGTLHTGR